MVGTGGTALVSQKLGEGDEKTAKRYFTMMIMLTVILGAVLTTFGLISVSYTPLDVYKRPI